MKLTVWVATFEDGDSYVTHARRLLGGSCEVATSSEQLWKQVAKRIANLPESLNLDTAAIDAAVEKKDWELLDTALGKVVFVNPSFHEFEVSVRKKKRVASA